MVLVGERRGQLGVLGGGVGPRHGAVLRAVRAVHRPVATTIEKRRQLIEQNALERLFNSIRPIHTHPCRGRFVFRL